MLKAGASQQKGRGERGGKVFSRAEGGTQKVLG